MFTHTGNLLRWIVGGTALVAILAAIAIAAWPASAADQAYDDGERLGQAVTDLYNADTTYEVNDALTEVRDASRDARIHAGDEVANQTAEQGDALAQAANGYLGVHSSTDEWESDVYQSELDGGIDDLEQQAQDFRDEGPEVQQAFWDGVDAGLNG
jgi:hypothetical protein